MLPRHSGGPCMQDTASELGSTLRLVSLGLLCWGREESKGMCLGHSPSNIPQLEVDLIADLLHGRHN